MLARLFAAAALVPTFVLSTTAAPATPAPGTPAPTAPSVWTIDNTHSGVGFQIAATIGVGVFIGYQLDKWVKTPQPYFTLVLSFVFVILSLFIGLKDLGKKE